MPPRLPCEFFLIRYVPDVVKGEFVNIGVLLREAAGGAQTALATQVRFTRDWARVRCMDADADTALLEGLESEIAGRLLAGTSPRDPRGVLEVLEDSLSNSVQITESRAVLAENIATEMAQLMRLYVEPMKVVRTRGEKSKTGRAGIQAAMRTEFERTGAWALMRKRVNASMYTRPGDPLRLDCGYKTTGNADQPVIRMFQAVSLAGEVEAAKVLAYSAPQLVEGVRRVENAMLELTAVVEPIRSISDSESYSDEASERYAFAVDAMERQGIRAITLNDLARAAQTAQRELGL